jgi:hypothetical protein
VRVFLDTNVLAAAFTTRGLCADLVRSVLAEHQLITGEVILGELNDVLVKRFRLPASTTKDILACYEVRRWWPSRRRPLQHPSVIPTMPGSSPLRSKDAPTS